MVDFGQKLKELRISAGLTQQQVADRIWVTKATVSYYEQSARTPSPEMLVKVAKLFNVSTDYLLGLEKKCKYIDVSSLDDDDIQIIQSLIKHFISLKSAKR